MNNYDRSINIKNESVQNNIRYNIAKKKMTVIFFPFPLYIESHPVFSNTKILHPK
jgi:hypothetical protein